MLARFAAITMLLLALSALASCGGGGSAGQDTEAGVTAGGEAKRKEVLAHYAQVRDQVRPVADDVIRIADGQKQFKRKCAFCHGVDGQKKIPLAIEADHRVSKFAPDDIAVQVHSGVNIHGKVTNHKQFPTLNGAELYATLLYVQNFYLQGDLDDPWTAWKARLEVGKAQFATNCANCHATLKTHSGTEVATSPAPETGGVPIVAAPTFDREYLFTHSPQSMSEAVLANTAHGTAGFEAISEADRWAMAYWLQSLLYELP